MAPPQHRQIICIWLISTGRCQNVGVQARFFLFSIYYQMGERNFKEFLESKEPLIYLSNFISL